MAGRAAQARWQWKASRARAGLTETFASHGRSLVGEWSDVDQAAGFTAAAVRLGPARDRFIQRWPAKRLCVAAAVACGPALSGWGPIWVSVLDAPDTEWIRVAGDLVLSELVPAAGDWMTDGFIAYDPGTDALLSVDVEGSGGVSYLETTLIGEGMAGLKDCFLSHGPPPLGIVDQEAVRDLRRHGR